MMVTGEDGILTTGRVTKVLPSMQQALHVHLVGDVHFDSPTCNRTAFRRVIKHIKKQHDAGTPYLVYFMGDQLDRCSASERSKIARAALHESTRAGDDKHAMRDVDEFYDIVSFMKGNIGGVIQGNHYWRFLTGDLAGKSSDAYLADKLDAPWLGFLTYQHVTLNFARTTKAVPLDLVLCHGKGGGKMVGTSINQVNDLRRIFPAAHVFAMGHNHQAGAVPASALFASAHGASKDKNSLDIQERKQLLIRTGSFLKGYEQDTPSYVVEALYSPSTVGHAEILVETTVSKGALRTNLKAVV
jgi:hypothetical protein